MCVYMLKIYKQVLNVFIHIAFISTCAKKQSSHRKHSRGRILKDDTMCTHVKTNKL